MSAVDNVDAGTAREIDDDDDYEPPGLWESFGTALRLIVGWFCVAIGVLNLIVEADRQTGTPDVPFFLFHALLLVGGILLLSLGLIAPRPGALGYTVFGAVMVLGTAISALPVTTTVCCLSAFDVRHGFPFTFAAHDAGARWHIDSQHLLADLMFWGYAGLILLVLLSVVRGRFGEHGSADESVGPLP